MSMPKISIVIPALNEEEFLPKLLESIKNQTFTDYEVIVADAGSKDKTVKLAKKYGAQVVPGGMPGPGRNRGAEVAKGDFLFFFDSDVVIPPDFLEKAYNEIQDRFLDLATCEFQPDSELRLDKLMFDFANLSVKMNQVFNPRAAGFCIFISRRLFERIEGFDESVLLAEDHDLVQRASVYRPLRVLESTKLKVSIRRLEKEGRFSLIAKYAQVEMHLLTKGKVKENIVEYEFGNFGDDAGAKNAMDELEKRVIQMEELYNSFSKKYLSGNTPAPSDPPKEANEAKSAFDSIAGAIKNLFVKEGK